MVDVGTRLREVRKAHGLSQSELARRSGVTRQTINSTEMGKNVPTIETLQKLADGLKAELEVFFRKSL